MVHEVRCKSCSIHQCKFVANLPHPTLHQTSHVWHHFLCLHFQYTRIERIQKEKQKLIKEGKWPPAEEKDKWTINTASLREWLWPTVIDFTFQNFHFMEFTFILCNQVFSSTQYGQFQKLLPFISRYSLFMFCRNKLLVIMATVCWLYYNHLEIQIWKFRLGTILCPSTEKVWCQQSRSSEWEVQHVCVLHKQKGAWHNSTEHSCVLSKLSEILGDEVFLLTVTEIQ